MNFTKYSSSGTADFLLVKTSTSKTAPVGARHALLMRPGQGIVRTVVLEIIKYGHPVLREKGKKIDKPTEEIRQLAADMLQTMYAADGVGLAAQQVGRSLLLTVIDATATDRPSELFVDGQPCRNWLNGCR